MLGRLPFLIARTLRHEAPLAALSVPVSTLLDELAGKHVAIVGNARALADKMHGPDIDAADLVIRINRAPMPSPASHGSRTDWLALATSLNRADEARIRPGRFLWMSPKRKRLPYRVAASPGFYLHPLADYERLKSALAAPPTTGLMVINLVSQSRAASVRLYGFDFFASLSLTGSRTADQVPHRFPGEQALVEALMARDPRISFGDR